MPLSANFKREMLDAMKTAKKKREKDKEGKEDTQDTKGLEDKGSVLAKPVAITRSVKIEEGQAAAANNKKVIEKSKSQH